MKGTMDRFAGVQASRQLGKLTFQVRRAARHPTEEAIHDLRVAIRRMSQCLLEFRQFFPRHNVKKILKQLGKVMDIAAEMRNRDVALGLIGASGSAALTANLSREREQAKQELIGALQHWRRRDFSRRWRPWLARR